MHYSGFLHAGVALSVTGWTLLTRIGVHSHSESAGCGCLGVAGVRRLCLCDPLHPLQGIDGLVHFLAVLEKGLLLLDCLTLLHKHFCFLQGQLWVHLKARRLRQVMDANDDAIAHHLVLEFALLAVLRQAVQAGNKLFHCFVLSQAATDVECPLKNHVLPNLEEPVKLTNKCVVLLPISVRDVSGSKSVLCIFSHAVQQHTDLSVIDFS